MGAFTWMFLVTICANHVLAQRELQLDVYYESLCPYSKRFIVNQLEPAATKLWAYMDVDLLPYGNAEVVRTKEGQEIEVCQHGENECLGNKIHACGLEKLTLSLTKVQFVACVMKDTDPIAGGENCSPKYGLDWDEVRICAMGRDGQELHRKYGKRTTELMPQLEGVPTTIINQVRGSDAYQDRIRQNLMDVVCEKLKKKKKNPPHCRLRRKRRSISRFWIHKSADS